LKHSWDRRLARSQPHWLPRRHKLPRPAAHGRPAKKILSTKATRAKSANASATISLRSACSSLSQCHERLVPECRLCTYMCACLQSRSLAVRVCRALTDTLDVGDDGRVHDGCATPEGAARHSGGALQSWRRYSAQGAGCCQSGSYRQPARPCSAVVRTLWAAATEGRRHDGEGDARTGGAIRNRVRR
jgi:hypothetical protein